MPLPEEVGQLPSGSPRWARILAISWFTSTLAMVGFSLISLVLPGAELMIDHPHLADFLAFSLIFTAFPAVGLAVAWVRPTNPLGWIFLAIGFGIVTSVFGSEYAGRAAYVGWDLPAVEIVAWLSGLPWAISSGLALTFAVLLFPDGRLPGPRWRPVAWLAATVIGLASIGGALDPRSLDGYGVELTHPIPVDGALRDLAIILSDGGLLAMLLIGVVCVGSLVARFRRARGVERLQIKALLFPVALFLLGLAAASTVQSDVVWTIALAGLATVPVGAGIAILRYRLFDIDLVINRTLVYASLSVVLGATYVALILVLQALLAGITQNNAPAVALSTLAVAGLFGPARRRLQNAVDRRFYRSRYDAATTLARFAVEIRNEVDIGRLTAELRRVADEVLQPRGASVWLRKGRS